MRRTFNTKRPGNNPRSKPDCEKNMLRRNSPSGR
jgi:hypothetical protein